VKRFGLVLVSALVCLPVLASDEQTIIVKSSSTVKDVVLVKANVQGKPAELRCFTSAPSCSEPSPGEYSFLRTAADSVYNDCTNVVLYKSTDAGKEKVGVYCWDTSGDCYMFSCSSGRVEIVPLPMQRIAPTLPIPDAVPPLYPITATCVGISVVRGVPIKPRVPLIPHGGEGPPYKFSATGLLSGLSMAADGTLSGIPTVTGPVNYAVTITDPVGNKGTINMGDCGTWEDAGGPNVKVKVGKLIHMVRPEYPVGAKSMQISGTVRLRITIRKDGTVGDLQAISGPKELIPSAVEAVKHWRYQPYSINNDPIAVETFIDVVF
jgi:TonB family protein